MSLMLHPPSRASTSSSSSFIPVSRQNTMSSMDGSRSVRQSKRYSVTALYLSMSAKERDLEIEDDLARGSLDPCPPALPASLTVEQPRKYCAN